MSEMIAVEIQSLANKNDVLTIGSQPGHDMWVKTERGDHDNDDYQLGEDVRIYSYVGSANFADLHDQFYKAFTSKSDLNKNLFAMNAKSLDLKQFEKVELIEAVADKAILAAYRDEAGRIGIQTMHTERDDIGSGPIVWVCGEKEHDDSPAMRARRRIFEPIFDLTQTLAKSFNEHNRI